MIPRKIDRQKKKAGTGHRQDREKIVITMKKACNTGTEHQQYRDKQEKA